MPAGGDLGGGNPNRWVVAAAAVVMQAALGSFYSWSVFRGPLSEAYGAGATGVGFAFFLANLSFTFAAFGGGVLMRRVGPRVVGVSGGALYGLGVALSGLAGESLALLYLTYGVVAGAGLGLGYMAPVAALPRWFPDRPGLAYGIAVCGFGFGSAVNAPVAAALIPALGGPFAAFAVLGAAYLVLAGGAALFVGYPPEGGGTNTGRGPAEDARQARRGLLLREAVRTPQWHAMWGIFLLNVTAGLAVLSDARALAVSVGGASAALATLFVVFAALSDTAGRLVWPALSDRIGHRGAFFAMFVLQAAAFVALPLVGAGSFAVFCVLCGVVLACYGGGYGVMPAFVDAYYGPRDIGAIYGAIIVAVAPASFGAPLLLALAADTTGSYDAALYAIAALMLAGALVPLAVRPPGPTPPGPSSPED